MTELEIKYKKLLATMDDLTEQIPYVIFEKYFKNNCYLYSVYYEAFSSIRAFCILLGNNALIAQSCMSLRMAIENTAIIKVLEMYPLLMDEFIEHCEFRFELKTERKFKEKIIEHYKEKIKLKNNNALNFLEYGWLRSIRKDYGYRALLQTAGFDKQPSKFLPWIDWLNLWVHGAIKGPNIILNVEDGIRYVQVLIDIAAQLLEILCCNFHNTTKSTFIVNNINYYEKFYNVYKSIIKANEIESNC